MLNFCLILETGRADIVEFLLNNSKNIIIKKLNHGDPEKKAPLYISFENRRIDVIKLLLLNEIIREKKYDYINYETFKDNYVSYFIIKHKKAVLHYAVQNNLIEYVRVLLDNPETDVNLLCETYSTLWITSLKHEKEFSDIEEVFDLDDPFEEYEKQTALHIAVKCKNIKMVKLI